jgi:Uma2 family endonuclease
MAELALQPPPLTFEDAARLDPDQYAGEIVDGEWIPMTRNTWRHGEVVRNVTFVLTLYMREHREWTVAAGDPGTKLRSIQTTLRGPDVAIIRADRRPTGRGAEGWLDGAPELAVEVTGETQKSTRLARKALEYLAAGSQMVWVVDPDEELVMVFTSGGHLQVLGSEEMLDGGDVLPGFSCKVSEFFE